MSFVIDASIAISWGMTDENSEIADEAFSTISKTGAFAPVLFMTEVVNIIQVALRHGRISSEVSRALRDQYSNLAISYDFHIHEYVFDAVADLASKHNLSAYDASYLELALRMELPLATLDKKLAHAARQEGVQLLGKKINP